jgi:hypothetical protein
MFLGALSSLSLHSLWLLMVRLERSEESSFVCVLQIANNEKFNGKNNQWGARFVCKQLFFFEYKLVMLVITLQTGTKNANKCECE